LIEHGDGRRSAGAAAVDAGRPFAIARAAWAALEAGD
jgi:hypothetical protein